MPMATLLSSYAEQSRSYSLVIGKSVIRFDSGIPKQVSPSVAAKLSTKMEEERDYRGRKTGRRRCMFKITDMPNVKTKSETVRKKTASKPTSTNVGNKTPVKGQRRLA